MEALNFHFHVPTEHVFEGKRYDAEMHFIHEFYGGIEGSDFMQATHCYTFSVNDYHKIISEEDAH